jgi:hypothetical protein
VTVIVEEHLRFEFGPSWQVEKYDDETSMYRKGGIERLKEQIPCKQCLKPRDVGTKAVDFVGRRREHDDQIYLIEVKDFRGHAVENRRRAQGELAFEVAIKVRDTLAGLVGALHRPDTPSWRPLVAPLLQRPPKVLLWLEEDMSPARTNQRGDPTMVMRTALSQRLSWLNPHVMVMNKEKLWPALDLYVQNLPDRVYRVREAIRVEGDISFDDFCKAWAASPQVAGEVLKKLCEQGSLRRVSGKNEVFIAGPAWEKFHEEPA